MVVVGAVTVTGDSVTVTVIVTDDVLEKPIATPTIIKIMSASVSPLLLSSSSCIEDRRSVMRKPPTYGA
jgi:hypothetical protein